MDFAERRRRPSQRQAVVKVSSLQHEDLDKVISVCCAQVSCCSMHCTVRRLVIEQVFCTRCKCQLLPVRRGSEHIRCVHCSTALCTNPRINTWKVLLQLMCPIMRRLCWCAG